jgi:hypothetical protein
MATINLMMGETYLKQNSIINDNADMTVITPTIEDVQRLYIEDLLGTQLYNSILGQIASNNVSSLNQTLLDTYVLPCMKYYILCECTPVFKWRYMNKGVMIKNSENSSPASTDEILYMMDKWKNNAEKLAQRVTRYLTQEQALYPLYRANTKSYESRPNINNYTNGLYLDDLGDLYNYKNNIDTNP